MTEDELIAVIESELDLSGGEYNSELADNRAKALGYYMGHKRGDELPNRSQVISTDVADALDWILAQVMKAFSEAETIAQFKPRNAEDVERAQQESDYCSYLYWQRNNGFLTTYTWIKDALLSKNGYVHVFWDESEKVTTARYKGLTDQQIALLESKDDVSIEEHTSYEEVIQDPSGMTPPAIASLHDVTIKRTYTEGCARVMPIPPENTLVADEHATVDLDECRFVAHEREMTKSQLIELGIDKKIVDELPANEDLYDQEDYARDAWDEQGTWNSDDSKDPSQQRVTVYDCTLQVDYDGDGIAELHKVLYSGHHILEEEEIDYSGWVAAASNILTHKHNGISIYDRLKQIQDQKTAILRNVLDNHYLVNNQRWKVKQGGRVNLDQLLDNRPGGPIMVKEMTDLEPLTIQPLASQGFQILDYLDKQMHARTGAGSQGRGEDIPLPNSTAHGVERIMSAKEELVGLMIRLLAETGFKKIWRKLHAVVRHNQDVAEMVELRNKWVEVNPLEWQERRDMSIKVGLGNGDRMRQQGVLANVMSLQEKMLDKGGFGILVEPQHIHNAASDMVRSGQLDPDRYFADPSEPQRAKMFQQMMQSRAQQQDPAMEIQKLLLQVEGQKNQIRASEAKVQAQDMQQKAVLERYRTEMEKAKIMLEQAEAQAQAKHKRDELSVKYEGQLDDMKTKLTELSTNESLKSRELDLKEREIVVKEADTACKTEVERRKCGMEEAEAQERRRREQEAAMADYQALQKIVNSLSDTIARMNDSNTGVLQAVESVKSINMESSSQQTAMIAELSDSMREIGEKISAPKRLIRDAQGRPVGVETVESGSAE